MDVVVNSPMIAPTQICLRHNIHGPRCAINISKYRSNAISTGYVGPKDIGRNVVNPIFVGLKFSVRTLMIVWFMENTNVI